MKKPTPLPAGILFFAVPLLWLTLTEAASVNPSGAAIRPYYEGKTLQLIVVFGPGGVTDISARLVARYWGKYIPGNPSVIVQNMPGASGVVGANHLYNLAKRDGLTIAAMGRGNYLEQMIGRPEVRLDLIIFLLLFSFI
jgi:tripartite-type tricarboxylate transporter receptor subunit TctC